MKKIYLVFTFAFLFALVGCGSSSSGSGNSISGNSVASTNRDKAYEEFSIYLTELKDLFTAEGVEYTSTPTNIKAYNNGVLWLEFNLAKEGTNKIVLYQYEYDYYDIEPHLEYKYNDVLTFNDDDTVESVWVEYFDSESITGTDIYNSYQEFHGIYFAPELTPVKSRSFSITK